MPTPSDFETLVCDMQCALSACEQSYRRDGRRPLSLLVFPRPGDPSEAGHWLSRACHPKLAYRLLVEIDLRGFNGFHLEHPRQRPLRAIVLGTLWSYKQRRLGLALLRHRAALRVVSEAGGLGDLYDNAGLQLQALAVCANASLSEIRRAERFAECVRLSGYHALLARDFEVMQ